MTFDFDKAFHKPNKSIPKDCPCRKCDEPKYSVDNPYYQSTKCEECKVYKDWRQTMAEKEYIEKETVLKHFDEVMNNEFCDSDFKKAALRFSIYVSRLAAADVAPVKHGHFRRLTFSNDTIICSECKMAYNIFETNGAENFNFCPHCGTKIMDGGEDNG